MTEVEQVLGIGNQLGEGPLWDPQKGLLFWVDIEAGCFHRFCPVTAQVETFDTGITVSALGRVAASDKLIMATTRGVVLWNWPDPRCKSCKRCERQPCSLSKATNRRYLI